MIPTTSDTTPLSPVTRLRSASLSEKKDETPESDLAKLMSQLSSQQSQLSSQLAAMDSKFDSKFAAMNSKIDAINSKLVPRINSLESMKQSSEKEFKPLTIIPWLLSEEYIELSSMKKVQFLHTCKGFVTRLATQLFQFQQCASWQHSPEHEDLLSLQCVAKSHATKRLSNRISTIVAHNRCFSLYLHMRFNVKDNDDFNIYPSSLTDAPELKISANHSHSENLACPKEVITANPSPSPSTTGKEDTILIKNDKDTAKSESVSSIYTLNIVPSPLARKEQTTLITQLSSPDKLNKDTQLHDDTTRSHLVPSSDPITISAPVDAHALSDSDTQQDISPQGSRSPIVHLSDYSSDRIVHLSDIPFSRSPIVHLRDYSSDYINKQGQTSASPPQTPFTSMVRQFTMPLQTPITSMVNQLHMRVLGDVHMDGYIEDNDDDEDDSDNDKDGTHDDDATDAKNQGDAKGPSTAKSPDRKATTSNDPPDDSNAPPLDEGFYHRKDDVHMTVHGHVYMYADDSDDGNDDYHHRHDDDHAAYPSDYGDHYDYAPDGDYCDGPDYDDYDGYDDYQQ